MGFDQGTDFQITNQNANGNIHLKPTNGRVFITSSYDNNNVGGTLMLRHPGKTDQSQGQNMDWVIYSYPGVGKYS